MNRKISIPAGVITGIAILLGVLNAVGLSGQAPAQEGVVRYLEGRFKELNIPVKEVTILTESPLHLQVIVQSTKSTTFEELLILHAVEREVFITARQQGYMVDRLAKILVDDQGKQIYFEDTGFNADLMTVDLSPSHLSNDEAEELVSDLLIDEYKFYGDFVTNVNISSSNGLQTLDIQLIVPSLEEANKVAGIIHGMLNLAEGANAQGVQIVIFTLEIKDEKDHIFMQALLDVQLRSISWSQDENLIDLSPHPPVPPSTHTPQPILTITPTP
jgi:hypothetical protein